MDGLQPYPAYKDSGLPWLGQVPAHWEMRRMKFLLREIDSRSTTGKEQLLRVSQYTGVTLRKSLDGSEPDTRASSLVGYKKVAPNNLVINIMLAWNGSLGVARHEGIASPAYCVYRFNDGALPGYYHELLRTPIYKGRIKIASTGVVESRLRLYSDDLGRIEALLPPSEEQATIARYLDHATRKIDKTIRAKRKIIALLNEQKQAIIHRAVTRGLDPDVPLKDSGIPWLGQIPAHWDIRPMKQLLIRMDYGTSENARGEGTVRVLTMGHIRDGAVVIPDRGSLDSVPAGLSLQTNDLLFNRTNSAELVGKVGLFSGPGSDDITFASYLVRLRVKPEHSPYWLNYLLNSVRFWSYARSQALVSLHQANLNPTRYGQMLLPVPPRNEQDSIVDHVSIQAREIGTTAIRIEREISLLHEYRTRLIADVVTGKLDVRAAAARLPEPGEEEAPEIADVEDDEEALEEAA